MCLELICSWAGDISLTHFPAYLKEIDLAGTLEAASLKTYNSCDHAVAAMKIKKENRNGFI
jgi:hypothetical protein